MRPHTASRGRRLTAFALTAALAGSLLSLSGPLAHAAPPAPAAKIPHPLGARKADVPKDVRHDKLGSHDRTLLQKARSGKEKTVTVLLAAPEGRTAQLRADLAGLGAHVATSDDRLGYVRATVPTEKAEKLAALGSVDAIDLGETFDLPDPSPVTAADRKAPAAGKPAAAPGKGTPAANPYLPTADTGAVDFVEDHPDWDGRGVTVGILDTGVDASHPALRTTTTGTPKIADWVTATDPVTDQDPTWLEMRTKVTGPSFSSGGVGWTAPEGAFQFQVFKESGTWGSELGGDVNRDGDYTDSFGVLYRKADHTIWVDTDLDHSFEADETVRPYAESGTTARFGTDDPATPVAESLPFTVEYRDDVDLSPRGGTSTGKTGDFVNIGIVSGAHGTHVAGIAAGHGLFGGKMNGAAPGARIVSERVCMFSSGCTSYALVEGMIDAVVNKHVDVVNLSVGGLPALNDGQNVRAVLYDRLIDEYGVQIFVSAGNDGPGMNTVGDPSVAGRVVSVGASVSRETWWADYGSRVTARQALFPFSARGPREDGGMKPTLLAPGAAVSSVPTWLPGSPVPQAGYELPPGYGMFNGTSMASPLAVGDAALLLSAAAGTGRGDVTPAALRAALTGSARFLDEEPAYAQGAGLISVPAAWKILAGRNPHGKRPEPTTYDVKAPVCGALSGMLATPDSGEGVYNRCSPQDGGQVTGKARTYDVEITRTGSGSTGTELSWLGNDGTFDAPERVRLNPDESTVVPVRARARTTGAHSAVLRVDDPATPGIDRMILVTVVVADRPASPSYRVTASGEAVRNRTRSLFVSVPKGATAVRLDLSRVAEGSQTRFLAVDPQGMPADDTAAGRCYTHYSDAKECDPTTRVYEHPMPGVWEFEVESRRTSPLLENPYRLTATVQGATLDPPSAVVAEAAVHAPLERNVTAVNNFAPVRAHAAGGALGALAEAHPTVGDQQMTGKQITVPRDASRFEVSMGNVSDPKADLDLFLVSQGGALVGSSTNGGSEETITVDKPTPGYYFLQIAGVNVPSGSTEFDIQDTMFADSLGAASVEDDTPVDLASGASLGIRGRLVAETRPPAGRSLVGRFSLVTDENTVIGSSDVLIGTVTQPKAEVRAAFGPAVAFDLDDLGRVVGSRQQAGRSQPIRWDAATGVTALDNAGAREGHALGASHSAGYAAGQLTLPDGTRGGVWAPDGTLTILPLPTWEAYTYDRAFAVNDAGKVVGNASGLVTDPATGRKLTVNEGFAWTKDGGFTKLPHLTPSQRSLTEPLALNNAGVVVGHSQKDGRRRAVRWTPDGTVTDLGTLPGMSDSSARDINEAGTVVGTSGHDAFVLQPGGTMTRLPDFGFDADAIQVNEAGWIVGTAEREPDVTTAVVWDPQGRMYDLGAMVDTDHWVPTEGIGVNNRGEVAFYAMDTTDGGSTKVVTAGLPG
ncbi:S8 family serine peptidase [Streptomyces sp. NPDC050529]|uniref:S8 family serine peptidase n=1 Tax=Streptomyces sp. NPDC050529 TaxID=3365624 RepID=UPI0037B54C43